MKENINKGKMYCPDSFILVLSKHNIIGNVFYCLGRYPNAGKALCQSLGYAWV